MSGYSDYKESLDVPLQRRFVDMCRPKEGRVIAGVAAAIADRMGVETSIVRIVFVLAALLSSGLGLVVYLVLWAVLPDADTLDDVLADRLERGEITADEYRQMLADMGETSQRRRR